MIHYFGNFKLTTLPMLCDKTVWTNNTDFYLSEPFVTSTVIFTANIYKYFNTHVFIILYCELIYLLFTHFLFIFYTYSHSLKQTIICTYFFGDNIMPLLIFYSHWVWQSTGIFRKIADEGSTHSLDVWNFCLHSP